MQFRYKAQEKRVLELVSRYAAARLLARDRQTIERAVRHLAPDAYHKGQPRWRLERIAAAVAMSPQQRREAGKARDRYAAPSAQLDEMRRRFEQGVGEIVEAAPDRRCALALKLAPLLQAYQLEYLCVGRRLRIVPDDVITARAELIWSEMMDEVSAAAQWPRHGSDFFIRMLEAVPSDDDDDEAT
jgi:hypothetical protein